MCMQLRVYAAVLNCCTKNIVTISTHSTWPYVHTHVLPYFVDLSLQTIRHYSIEKIAGLASQYEFVKGILFPHLDTVRGCRIVEKGVK